MEFGGGLPIGLRCPKCGSSKVSLASHSQEVSHAIAEHETDAKKAAELKRSVQIYELGLEAGKLWQQKRSAVVVAQLVANCEKAAALGVMFEPEFLAQLKNS
jgi:predicted  nucleic acid-binding Zn-ribbon protein